MKCSLVVRDVPIESYRLPADGRKWKHECTLRRSLAMQLATYADGDGTRITPSVQTLLDGMGLHRATIHRLLKDLKALGFLKDGAIGKLRTRERVLDLDAMSSKIPKSCSAWPPVADSQPLPDSRQILHPAEVTPVADTIPPVADSIPPVADRKLRVADTYQSQPSCDRHLTEDLNRESKPCALQKTQSAGLTSKPILGVTSIERTRHETSESISRVESDDSAIVTSKELKETTRSIILNARGPTDAAAKIDHYFDTLLGSASQQGVGSTGGDVPDSRQQTRRTSVSSHGDVPGVDPGSD